MISQKDSKQVSMDSWLLKLLSRDMKTKTKSKDQPTNNHKENRVQELLLLLAADKEHKKVFPDVPVVGFRNGKSLKDYLVRATLLKANETGRCEPCGKKTCLVCNSI